MDLSEVKTITLKDKVLGDDVRLSGYDGEYVLGRIAESRDFYEKDILRKWFYSNSAKTVYDIGANIGNHTVYFAKSAKDSNIYSLEPYAKNFAMLTKNITDNNLENQVQAFRLAAGEVKGSVRLSVLQDLNYGTASVVNTTNDKEGDERGAHADMVAIDDLGLPLPDFIKIDVEGFELPVLKGMERTLKTSEATLVWLELDADNAEAVYDFMTSCGYGMADFSLAINNNVLWEKGTGRRFNERSIFTKIITDDALRQKLVESNNKYRNLAEQERKLNVLYNDANDKYRNITGQHKTLKEQHITLTTEHKTLNEQHKTLNDEYTKATTMIALATTNLGVAIDLLESADIDIQRLRGQVRIFKKENSAYQWKLSRITDTWLGKCALWAYRMLRRIKRRLRGK